MSEYKTKILLGVVLAVLIAGGLAYAALFAVPGTGGGTSSRTTQSSATQSGSTLQTSSQQRQSNSGTTLQTSSQFSSLQSQQQSSGSTTLQTSSQISSVQSQQQSNSGTTNTVESIQTSSTSAPSGVLNLYLTDAPPKSPQFSDLLINVSSLTLRYQEVQTCTQNTPSEFVYTVPPKVGTNVNLTNLVGGKSVFLGATSIPSGNVTEIIFNIAGAKAFFSDGSSSQLKVAANGSLNGPDPL